MALLVERRTNNRKVVGSRPTKVVCITVLTCNRLWWTVRCGRPSLLLPSCRKLEFRLSALMDSDLAWVNGKSGRQSWCYADAFQRSIISGAIYHLPFTVQCYHVHHSRQIYAYVWFEAQQELCIWSIGTKTTRSSGGGGAFNPEPAEGGLYITPC